MEMKFKTDKMAMRSVDKARVSNAVGSQSPISSKRVLNTSVSLKQMSGEKFTSSNKAGTNDVKTTGGK